MSVTYESAPFSKFLSKLVMHIVMPTKAPLLFPRGLWSTCAFCAPAENAKTADCSSSNDLSRRTNRPSGKTDCIYEANVK